MRFQCLRSSVGSFGSMAETADVRLLRAVMASDTHVLHQIFSSLVQRKNNLRLNSDPFLLPLKMAVTSFPESCIKNTRPIHDFTLNDVPK